MSSELPDQIEYAYEFEYHPYRRQALVAFWVLCVLAGILLGVSVTYTQPWLLAVALLLMATTSIPAKIIGYKRLKSTNSEDVSQD